jgi:hypothetical protein
MFRPSSNSSIPCTNYTALIEKPKSSNASLDISSISCCGISGTKKGIRLPKIVRFYQQHNPIFEKLLGRPCTGEVPTVGILNGTTDMILMPIKAI